MEPANNQRFRRNHGFFVELPRPESERSGAFGRRVIAVLAAPAIAPVLLFAYDLVVDGDSIWILLPITLVVSFMFTLIPAALLMSLLHSRGWLGLWHFTVGGLVVGFICTSLFVLYAFPYFWSSPADLVREVLELHTLLIVSPVTGAFTWLISEWRGG